MLPFLAKPFSIDYTVNRVVTKIGVNRFDDRMQLFCGHRPVRAKQILDGACEDGVYRAASKPNANQTVLRVAKRLLEAPPNLAACRPLLFVAKGMKLVGCFAISVKLVRWHVSAKCSVFQERRA